MSPFDPAYRPAALDADRLTSLLSRNGLIQGNAVTQVEFEPCGTGQLADSFRFHLKYDREAAGPPSLVGKFASEEETSREFGRKSGYYRSEVNFYNELAPELGVSIPRALHAELHNNDTDFILLMEDLAPARQEDQIEGCSADDAARLLEQIAALHAGSWGKTSLSQKDWLKGPVGIFTEVTDNFAGVIKTFPELCGDLVPEADIREAARLTEHAQAWKQVFSEPLCLWHSDVRADNVLFDAQAGTRSVVLLDWQGLGFGNGLIDAAYWLGTSLPVDVRRSRERELIRHYHQALCAAGVEGYDEEKCWNDYRLHAIHGLQVGIFGLGAVRRSERGDRMWKNWIERCATQVRDLDSYALLD